MGSDTGTFFRLCFALPSSPGAARWPWTIPRLSANIVSCSPLEHGDFIQGAPAIMKPFFLSLFCNINLFGYFYKNLPP